MDVLRKHGFPIQKALLFGSWSRGCAGEESDVDVALISDVFTGDRFLDRRKIVPMPFTPQTFDMGEIWWMKLSDTEKK